MSIMSSCHEELSAATRCHFTNELRSDHQKDFSLSARAFVTNILGATVNISKSSNFNFLYVIDNRDNLYRSTERFVCCSQRARNLKFLNTETWLIGHGDNEKWWWSTLRDVESLFWRRTVSDKIKFQGSWIPMSTENHNNSKNYNLVSDMMDSTKVSKKYLWRHFLRIKFQMIATTVLCSKFA